MFYFRCCNLIPGYQDPCADYHRANLTNPAVTIRLVRRREHIQRLCVYSERSEIDTMKESEGGKAALVGIGVLNR